MKKKGVILIVGIILFGAIAGTASYYTWQKLQEEAYKSTYSLDEVNEKIFTMQKRSISQIETELKKELDITEGTYRKKGNFNFNIEGQSPLGGGNGNISLGNIDVQYQNKNLDVKVSDLSLSGSLSFFGQEMSSSFAIDALHGIVNSSGSYIQFKNIQQDIQEPLEQIPEEVINTLNKIGEGNGYINLTDNIFYSIIESQLNKQKELGNNMNIFFIDFFKNEPLVEAYKQEDTRYYLTISKSICELKKYAQGKGINNTNTVNYQDFKDTRVTCSEAEYGKIQDDLLNNSGVTVEELYIELSTTKTRFISSFLISNPDDEALKIKTGFEGVFSLISTEQSKFYVDITSNEITGSGILIETNHGNLSGYIDIDVLEYNFDSNMSFSGTVDSPIILGDYSFASPESTKLGGVGGVMIQGILDAKLSKNTGTITINNTLSGIGESEMSGNINISSNYNVSGEQKSGEMNIDGQIQMTKNAVPMSGTTKITWNNETTPTSNKGFLDYNLNITNIVSGKYKLSYETVMLDIIEATFGIPENIIPQKNIDALIKMNKRKVEKEREGAMKEKMQRLAEGEVGVFSPYELDALNSKTSSDLRTLASAIETVLTIGNNTFLDLINISETKEMELGKIHKGSINFSALRQNKSDFIGPDGSDYEIYIFEPKSEKNYPAYQVLGYRYTTKGKEIITKGNYISLDSSFPASLKYDETNKKYYERGEVIPYK